MRDPLHEVDVDGFIAESEGVDKRRARVGEEREDEFLSFHEVAPDGFTVVADG